MVRVNFQASHLNNEIYAHKQSSYFEDNTYNSICAVRWLFPIITILCEICDLLHF